MDARGTHCLVNTDSKLVWVGGCVEWSVATRTSGNEEWLRHGSFLCSIWC